jgi:benzylsuccinate CoA-transferase BbsE subunit
VGVLSGCRVLDLTDERGMLGARLLADMGAEVIRIEKPVKRDTESGADCCYLNAGKWSLSLNLEKEGGRELFRRLVRTADVLVETLPPGHLESLGLGYANLAKVNPGLVMASVTDFGQGGPYRDYKSCDLVAGALGGWLSVTGEPQMPLKPFGEQAYYAASLFMANGVMLALWHRHTTGKGQHIDISIMECAAATLDHVLVRYFYEGVISRRQGGRHWNNAFDIFPCQDGYVLISLLQQWETLVEWLDSEGMAGDLADAKWRDRDSRVRGIDHIREVLEKWTLTHNVAELVEKGQLMHFPWAAVTSVAGLLENPQLNARGYFTEIEYRGKKCKSPGVPVKMGRSPWRTGGRTPEVGEHNLDVYRDELGLSDGAIEALKREGVI